MPDPPTVRMATYWGETGRRCHFCKLPIPADESADRSIAGDAWAHFECWYDGGPPFERDPESGIRV